MTDHPAGVDALPSTSENEHAAPNHRVHSPTRSERFERPKQTTPSGNRPPWRVEGRSPETRDDRRSLPPITAPSVPHSKRSRRPSYAGDPANIAGEGRKSFEEARRRIAALGGVYADASFDDVVDDLRRYGQSVDLLVIGSHKYGPIDRVLEESISQLLADEPSSALLVLAAR
ncbi:MAG: hypothetical protein WBP81_39025 [Solirubrobacteraceae bacterium]